MNFKRKTQTPAVTARIAALNSAAANRPVLPVGAWGREAARIDAMGRIYNPPVYFGAVELPGGSATRK